MSASRIQIWQYITAIILIVVLTFHLLERVPWWFSGVNTYHETLRSTFVAKEYHSFWPILIILAYVAVFHGLNGLRIMLIEWIPRLAKIWTVLFWVIFVFFIIVASYNVVALPSLGS